MKAVLTLGRKDSALCSHLLCGGHSPPGQGHLLHHSHFGTSEPLQRRDPSSQRETWGGLAREFLRGLGRCVIPRGGEGPGFKRALVPGRKQQWNSGHLPEEPAV